MVQGSVGVQDPALALTCIRCSLSTSLDQSARCFEALELSTPSGSFDAVAVSSRKN